MLGGVELWSAAAMTCPLLREGGAVARRGAASAPSKKTNVEQVPPRMNRDCASGGDKGALLISQRLHQLSVIRMPQFAVNPVRRALLGAAASAAAMASLGPWKSAFAQEARPLPAYVAWKDASAMIVHSANT